MSAQMMVFDLSELDNNSNNAEVLLRWSCFIRDEQCALLHIPSVANIDFVYDDGNTALHYAARFGLAKVIDALVRAGADQTLKNARGETPCECAAAGGKWEVWNNVTSPILKEKMSQEFGLEERVLSFKVSVL